MSRARAATLLAGPIMNGPLAIVLFAASFMAGLPAQAYPLLGMALRVPTAALRLCRTGDLVLMTGGRRVRGLMMNYRVMQRNSSDRPPAPSQSAAMARS